MRIISVTGTKGKTTIVRIISHVISKLGEKTLRVDNEGHFINEKRLSTRKDSLNLFSGTPNVCPGRYLISMKDHFPDFTAILEASIGCGGEGLGYARHDIGIFTNVFEDHAQKNTRLCTKADLAREKNFIIRRIKKEGCLIFNADDKYVSSEVKKIISKKKIRFIPIGIKFKYFSVKEHLERDGIAISKDKESILLKTKQKTIPLINYKKLSWTFGGHHEPSVFNLMLSLGALWAYDRHRLNEYVEILSRYTSAKSGGRLAVFKNKKNVTVILDYAHEKHSLGELARLGNFLKTGKLIGILRLGKSCAPDKIAATSKAISKSFDYFIIYDKIDGVFVKKYQSKRRPDIIWKTGEISKLFSENLSRLTKKPVRRIIQEEYAIKEASKIAQKGDVVIIIWNSDPQKTVSYIKKYFRAV